ncbi:hypothetical protein R6Q59_019426, partial [Mikania micrantha]
VRTYSEWVIDGDYDWPTKCCHCQAVLQENGDFQTTRLGCLHVIHTSCLVSNIKTYPPHTAHVCPACTISIWPPKSVKDSGSRLHSQLKEAIVQTGIEKNVFGSNLISLAARPISTEPLVTVDDVGNGSLRNQFLKRLLSFWSSALPTLPITAPPRKDATADDIRRPHHRPSRMDPRKILLVVAILACLATMGILYYRVAQGGIGEEEEQ